MIQAMSQVAICLLFGSALLLSGKSTAQADQSAPGSQTKTAFVERDISFPSDGLSIPGTLCLPSEAKGKLPLVVMVAGSGPQDRDETIGVNKPFLDLAHGLAEQGIATLRFDKRTWLIRQRKIEQPAGPEVITLKWEFEDDAVAALEFAHKIPEADVQRIFLLGHSLGAMTAPYIAAQAAPENKPRGIVMLAAGSRPHYAYVDDQIRALLKSQGKTDTEIAATLEKQHQIISDIESGKLPPNQLLQGAPIHYMREMIALDPAGELKQQQIPALVLQGGKDIQVFQPDFELLKQALDSRKVKGDEAKLFPDLNHLFMTVQGESSMAAYQIPGKVAPEVVQTIAAWIHARSK